MTDLERELRDMMIRSAEGVGHQPRATSQLIVRARLRRMRSVALASAAVIALFIGGAVGVQSLSGDERSFVGPDRSTELRPNGNILQGESAFWQGNAAPPPPSGKESYVWDAFDQDTESFLYSDGGARIWVLGAEGVLADISCPASARCGREMASFGPDEAEITVPAHDGRSAQVIGFDGTLGDRISLAEAIPEGHELSDLAWSRDGTRLAVSTSFEAGALCGAETCGTVSIIERERGEHRILYGEGGTEATVIRDLAWSPAGDRLTFLVAPGMVCTGATSTMPRLMALTTDGSGSDRTLHVYDEYVEKVCVVADDYHVAFPHSWSPDGSRVAVTTREGIAEISAISGETVAQHPGDLDGPLAWFARR